MQTMHANYTVVLNDLLRNERTNQAIHEALSHYPMYKPQSLNEYIPNVIPTREELNEKLLNHYKYREIGFETVGRFLDGLDIAMCEIMPYYNQLMFTQDQDYNIIFNVDYIKTIDTDREGTATNKSDTSASSHSNATVEGEENSTVKTDTESNTETSEESNVNSNTNNNTKNVHSTTPQDSLSVTAENIDNVYYADDVSWNKGISTDNSNTEGSSTGKTTTDGTTTSNGANNQTSISDASSNTNVEDKSETKGKEKILETIKGNFGVVSAQDLVQKYREIIINIEQMIINDDRIKELFMMVY